MHKTLSRLTLSVATLLFLTNCAEARSVSQDTVETDYAGGNHDTASPAITPPPSNRPSNTQFSDVLLEYRQMNARLDRVSAPLRLKNAELCPHTFRDPGFSSHTLDDYPPRLQPVAEDIMGLSSQGIYVRSVRQGSPAAIADIETGDRILKLNGQYIPSGTTMKRFYAALSKSAFGGVKTRLTLRTPQGQDYQTSLRADTACDYPASVFYSKDVNGHTNGTEVFMTSELMQTVPDDVNLALIVAHEMAHAIAGHMEETPSQALELEADRMALVLMTRAGYNIDTAIAYWADAAHPHRDLQDSSISHPSITERYNNFRKERARIATIKAAQEPLTFD